VCSSPDLIGQRAARPSKPTRELFDVSCTLPFAARFFALLHSTLTRHALFASPRRPVLRRDVQAHRKARALHRA
jgi:hypothetical protein